MIGTEDFRKAAEAIRPYTDYVYLHVMGEPLCHPELKSLIEIAVEAGLKCAITTNGTLLNRVGDALISSGVYKVNISLHSLEGEDNAEYLKSVIDFADRASQSGVLTVLRLWNGGEENPENDGVIKYLKQRLLGEWRFGARGARIRHRLHLEYGERFEWPDANLPKITERVFCYGLSDHFGILSGGTVIPCCLDSEGIIALGNIFEKPISEILSSERAEKMRCGFKERIGVEPLCQRCGYATRFSKI
jgi:MoaA/NifB/PqqE/SkfB family radical SAM enzyme